VVRLVNSPNVTVNLANGRYLIIGIPNSPIRELSPDEKRRRALEIATAGYATYALRSTLQQVNVVFPTVRRSVLFLWVNRVGNDDAFSFRTSQLVATTTANTDWRPPRSPAGPLYFVEIGDRSHDLVEGLASDVRTKFSIPVNVLPRLSFDRVTYDGDRAQIVADELIAAIRQRYTAVVSQPTARVIGITSYDMYTKQVQNWAFTFSLRDTEDHVAVVSYARMNPVVFGNAPDAALLQSRLRKMVTKNIGIMCYGLPLSPNPTSVLYGNIGGTDELDVMTEDFAPRGRLE
jgi:predicted Zn-dependent protease